MADTKIERGLIVFFRVSIGWIFLHAGLDQVNGIHGSGADGSSYGSEGKRVGALEDAGEEAPFGLVDPRGGLGGPLVELGIEELLKVVIVVLAGLVFKAGKVEEEVEFERGEAAEAGHAPGHVHQLLPRESMRVLLLRLSHHRVDKVEII